MVSLKIDRENRRIAIVVPRFIPAAEHRNALHRVLDLALDGFENLTNGTELSEQGTNEVGWPPDDWPDWPVVRAMRAKREQAILANTMNDPNATPNTVVPLPEPDRAI